MSSAVDKDNLQQYHTFKVPEIPKQKIGNKRNIILNEETYIEEMGKIIQRDFFPDLEKLQLQNDYLNAMERNDIKKIRELHSKYSFVRTPGAQRGRNSAAASPATFETPVVDHCQNATPNSCDIEEVEVEKKECINQKEELKNMSLDQYLSLHTSEDNQSFQEIMKEAEKKHKQKYHWLYSAEEETSKKLILPSIEEQASCTERPLQLDSWGYRNRNYIMYVPDGVPLTSSELVEHAKLRQEINHCNTRLSCCPFDEIQNKEVIQELAASQARSLDGKIGVDGKELLKSEEKSVNGYSYVKTPSPIPGAYESPLITWGEIEGTPFLLDASDTPLRPTDGPAFRIPEPPRREKLALALAEKVVEKHRDRKQKAIEAARRQLTTPSPKSTMDRYNSMSPAAQRLASSIDKFSPSVKRCLGNDKFLRASYSPSPVIKSNRINTPKHLGTPGRNITDNLLKLPGRRPKAADYFS